MSVSPVREATKPLGSETVSATWLQGDYNYDGNVGLTDFTFLATNFSQALPDGPAATGSLVPEPSSVALTMGAALLICRRRRRVS